MDGTEAPDEDFSLTLFLFRTVDFVYVNGTRQ